MVVWLITGSRLGHRMLKPALRTLWRLSKRPDIVVLGDCPTGVDRESLLLCMEQGWFFVVFGADWSRGPVGGPERNSKMVDWVRSVHESARCYCIALPRRRSPGTYDCASKAKASGIVTLMQSPY